MENEVSNSNEKIEVSEKLKKKNRFRYGNYNRYYGTRIKGFERDPRLDLLPSEWFRYRSILDIGCNVGFLTLSIAKEFGPTRVLGIDIDANLIGIARKNIRHYCDKSEKLIGKFPASITKNCSAESSLNKFPKNVWFNTENYVLENDVLLEMVRPEFDIILALSITKWIHLNWGDDGIKRFFLRAFKHLHYGGRLIIEPQDFSTYAKRSKLATEMQENFRKIKFFPDNFKDYLLSSEVGFVEFKELGIPKAKSKGFERPLYVFKKPFPTDKRKLLA